MIELTNKDLNKKTFNFLKYNCMERWTSYYYQIKKILELNPTTVLEIGIGTKELGLILTENGVKYSSCDMLDSMNATYTQNIDNMNIGKKFDVVCAFQVLEHLPFDKFETSLINMKNHSNKYVIISLPNHGRKLHFSFKYGQIRKFDLNINISWLKKFIPNQIHFWEIGATGTKVKTVERIIKKHFKIIKKFKNPDGQYHKFYVLSNNTNQSTK